MGLYPENNILLHELDGKVRKELYVIIDDLHRQLAEAQEHIKRLRDAVSYSKHQCEGMRVWGGMSWTYHPFQAKRIFDVCEKVMTDTEPK